MWALASVACGAPPANSPPQSAFANVVVSSVEWRVTPVASGVAISLMVDGHANDLGVVDAAPETCAIGGASGEGTTLLCGNDQFQAAVTPGQLVVTHNDVQTVAISIGSSTAIKVAPYRMPVGSDEVRQ
ncbi:MAG: hypothetical protein QM831_22930 [Kofleriaceae bacterium]